MAVKVHIKNNRWAAGSFPNTAEGEDVFTITSERFANVLKEFTDIENSLDPFIDWDTDHFDHSMQDAEVLLTWNLPTENLAQKAPKLKWIHTVSAPVSNTCCQWTGYPKASRLLITKGYMLPKQLNSG